MGCCAKKKPEQLIEKNNTQEENKESSELVTVKLSYQDFEPLKLIGTGSFGKVLLVKYNSNNNLYAMKVLNKSQIKLKKQEENTKNERDLMVKLNNPFILSIKFAFQDESKLYIVSEFLQGGDLFYHLHHSTINLTEEVAKFYIIKIMSYSGI